MVSTIEKELNKTTSSFEEFQEDMENDGKESEIDKLTEVIGVFGKFQFTYTVLYGMSAIVMAFSGLGTKFLIYDVDHWCTRPPELDISVEDWLYISAPYLPDTSPPAYDRCHVFNVTFTDSFTRPNASMDVISCTSWEFDESQFQNTIIQRWSLVCDNDNYNVKTLSQSLFFGGATVGAFLAGPLADWYGRKTTFVISMFFYMAFSITSAFVDNPYAWIALRFFVGAAFIANSTSKTVYQSELTSGSWRARSQHWLGEMFWQIGYLCTGLAVFLIPDMKMFELFTGLSCVPFLLFWFLTPESPRWLLGKGRFDEAAKVMGQACKMNKRSLDNLEKINQSSEKDFEAPPKGFVTDLLRLPYNRRNLICMVTCWFSCSLGYYGLIYNTPAFDWNLYLVFVFPAFLAIPLVIAQPYFVNWIGRKILLTFTLTISGVFLLLTLAVPDGKFVYNWPIIVCCWLGTTCSQAAFGAGYVFTKDLFPTTHRATALSTVSAFARLGSLVSPFVALFDPMTTLVIYGVCLLASAVISSFIYPDTTLTKMPETLAESEKMAKSKFPCLSWYR